LADYKKLASVFEERADISRCYETRSFMKLNNELHFILQNETKQIIFLIGEPGCGKSVFLNNLKNHTPQGAEVIKFDTPFFEPVDFIKTLITKKGEDIDNYSLEELIKQAVRLYGDGNTVIAIDEAQLLSKELIELIRILSDSKAFWFLLAMHRHESKEILNEPQFSSRPHRILQFDPLSFEEVREYLSKELINSGEYMVDERFKRGLLKLIFKLSRGNFRDLKKILNRLFLIMDQGRRVGKKGYEKPNRCLVTMAAIDGDLIDI